nr:unnamed protein product [Haemonchus contortus]
MDMTLEIEQIENESQLHKELDSADDLIFMLTARHDESKTIRNKGLPLSAPLKPPFLKDPMESTKPFESIGCDYIGPFTSRMQAKITAGTRATAVAHALDGRAGRQTDGRRRLKRPNTAPRRYRSHSLNGVVSLIQHFKWASFSCRNIAPMESSPTTRNCCAGDWNSNR